MSPTTTPSRPAPSRPPRPRATIDPRISARRTEVTRQQGRRRLRVVGAVLAVALLVFGAWSLLQSSLFSARAVTVVGATHETTAQIEAAAGLSHHPPLLDVDTAAAVRGLEGLPWVRTAAVSVHWPDLAASGRVLAVVPARPPGLLEMSGPQPPGSPGTTVGAPDRLGLLVASTLPVSFRAQVTAVNVEPGASGAWVQLTMTTPILVNIGNASQLTAKYEDVTTMLANVALHDGDTIDVSVPGVPTVSGP